MYNFENRIKRLEKYLDEPGPLLKWVDQYGNSHTQSYSSVVGLLEKYSPLSVDICPIKEFDLGQLDQLSDSQCSFIGIMLTLWGFPMQKGR